MFLFLFLVPVHSIRFLLCASSIPETLEPDVKIFCLSIISPGRSDIVLPIPEDGKPNGIWFTLKEGSKYKLKFSFQVSNNIVSGLKYTNSVWKTGIKGKLSVFLYFPEYQFETLGCFPNNGTYFSGQFKRDDWYIQPSDRALHTYNA